MVTLGIDFGTSSTAAVVGLDDGRATPLLFGETPLLPSAVCLAASGELIVGRDAVQASRSRPEWFEGHPKSRIDEGELLLGDRAVPVADAIAAVLRRVHGEALRVAGAAVDRVVLTHPAGWGGRRRQVLLDAAARAGLPPAGLVAEPVSAASFYVYAMRGDVPPGRCLVVYDFGAGTFDASVVRRTADGFAVLAAEGLNDAGGLDIDAAVVAHLGATYGAGHPEAWQRLTAPRLPADRRASRAFWDDVRAGKEALSRTAMATIFVPILEVEAVLGREQLDHLAGPLLERTVATTRLAVRNAGIGPADIAAVFLVGGSSRMSLAPTLLHQALGVAPTVIEQPELIVAGGTLHFHRATVTAPTTGPVTAPVSAVPAAPVSMAMAPVSALPVSVPPVAPVSVPPSVPPAPPNVPPAPPSRQAALPLRWVLTAAAAVVIALATTLIITQPWLGKPMDTGPGQSPTPNRGTPGAPTDDQQAEAATKVPACERQHGMTKAKQSTGGDTGSWVFKGCEWPPTKLTDADGYSEIRSEREQGPGDSSASGTSAADRIDGPCDTFEVSYDYGHMGESRHLNPFKAPAGEIWIVTYDRDGEPWTGDRTTLPFYPVRNELVVLATDNYAITNIACA
ncbi:Hsp70 family protein [Dactylosporangium sp. NPDC051541]|uniref:Hsp70 family protein n=1 Tax=Dactylosporangium sp. NPDC051541 TaxID=3363977 RepID=UPI003789CEF4